MDTRYLKVLANRQRFKSIKDFIPRGMVTPEILAMIQWFEVYFSTFPEHEEVQVDDLKWLVQQRSQGSAPESLALTLQICEQLRQPVDESTVRGTMGALYDLDFAGRAGALLAAYDRGEDVDIVHEIHALAQQVKRARSNGKADEYLDLRIGDILAEIDGDVGIKFRRLETLNRGIAAIQGGASIAVGMRPDKGKTSLVADFLTDWAPQCVQFFGADRPILWLNNEGSGKRIIPRIYQAALKLTLEEITELSNAGKLEEQYLAAIGAQDLHYIRVKDIHGANLGQIEQIIEQMNPCVVVYDMLANVRMNLGTGNKADAVEAAWQTVREYAVMYNHIALSTVQVSAEGGNLLFPPYSALKDSKTGIQGATDIIIIGGALDDPRYQTIRGISTPKNKFSVTGMPSYLTLTANFDGARCGFTQMEGADQSAPPPPPGG